MPENLGRDTLNGVNVMIGTRKLSRAPVVLVRPKRRRINQLTWNCANVHRLRARYADFGNLYTPCYKIFSLSRITIQITLRENETGRTDTTWGWRTMLRIWSESALDSTPVVFEQDGTAVDPAYLVKWDENDHLNPQNWPIMYKWWVVFQLVMLSLAASLGSGITTPVDDTIAEYVGVSREIAVLDVSLYL